MKRAVAHALERAQPQAPRTADAPCWRTGDATAARCAAQSVSDSRRQRQTANGIVSNAPCSRQRARSAARRSPCATCWGATCYRVLPSCTSRRTRTCASVRRTRCLTSTQPRRARVSRRRRGARACRGGSFDRHARTSPLCRRGRECGSVVQLAATSRPCTLPRPSQSLGLYRVSARLWRAGRSSAYSAWRENYSVAGGNARYGMHAAART